MVLYGICIAAKRRNNRGTFWQYMHARSTDERTYTERQKMATNPLGDDISRDKWIRDIKGVCTINFTSVESIFGERNVRSTYIFPRNRGKCESREREYLSILYISCNDVKTSGGSSTKGG